MATLAQDIVANSSEIINEGKLKVGTDKKKLKERLVRIWIFKKGESIGAKQLTTKETEKHTT